jgi:glucosamine-6-phosphate deaminase
MQVFIYESPDKVAAAAAMVFAAELAKKPNLVMGLATGSTPVLLYKELARLNREKLADFSKAASYNLDEYEGLDGTHPCSYRYFMNENLFDHINIDKRNTFVPSGIGDVSANARAYDEMVEAAGGIDLQLLGIGHNGHIGFNEPGDAFVYGTNVVTLTPSTINANARYFDKPEDMPRRAITLGNGGIMAAKRVILLATGAGKAQAIYDTIKGDPTPRVPSSILRFHPNVQVFLDAAAAGKL